jgi:hypothetical protein
MMDNTQITQVQQNVSAGYNKFTIKTNTSKESNRFRFKNDTSATTDFIFSELVILEGDYTNIDVTYFEGMASVKMPVLKTVGKNLLEGLENGSIDSLTGKTIAVSGESRSKNYMTINGQPFTISRNVVLDSGSLAIRYYDINKNYIGADTRTMSAVLLNMTFTPPTEAIYMKFKVINSNLDILYQVEQGSTPTAYEPYKSNILSVSEEVELRGIGNVKDELDLTTGELTERIGEYIITGDENWSMNTQDNCQRFSFYSKNIHNIQYNEFDSFKTYITCDKLRGVYWANSWNTINTITINNGSIYFHLPLGTTMEQAKAMMIGSKIQYQFATESVKTVDLSTLNQNSKKTELSTFDDITHVTVSSEGLAPKGEITVATKNATDVVDASVMSLRMDDILNSQGTLEGSANTQSDDIDVAMLGTTDIYEQLL